MTKAAPQRPRYAPAFQRPTESVASPAAPQDAVDVEGLAYRLSISVETAKRLCSDGTIRSFRIGRLRRISTRSISEFIERREQESEGVASVAEASV